ncbi:LPS export ABC transporter permease LptG [Azomonas macrocytogenes]|nr:LPS export ABC transporter permease LptG [Azomonas macrocytogenes]
MKIVDRYLLRNMFLGFVAAAALLLPLFSALDLVNELDDVKQGGYRLIQAVEVVMMTLPRRIVELGPFIALLGGIAALGQLAQTQELSVLRAAGISATRISMTTLLAGLILAGLIGMIDEFAASPLQQKALQIRTQAIALTDKDSPKDDSIWARKSNYYARIDRLSANHIPTHLEIFGFDENKQLKEYIYAEYADIQSGKSWLLHDVRVKKQNGSEETSEHFDELPWQSIFPETRLNEVNFPPESFSSQQLYRYIKFLHETGQPSAQYSVALWQKVGTPILALAMILFAVPFAFSQVRSTGLGAKLSLGAMLGLLVYMTNNIIASLGILFKINPVLVGTLPAIIMFGIAMLAVTRFDTGKY